MLEQIRLKAARHMPNHLYLGVAVKGGVNDLTSYGRIQLVDGLNYAEHVFRHRRGS